MLKREANGECGTVLGEIALTGKCCGLPVPIPLAISPQHHATPKWFPTRSYTRRHCALVWMIYGFLLSDLLGENSHSSLSVFNTFVRPTDSALHNGAPEVPVEGGRRKCSKPVYRSINMPIPEAYNPQVHRVYTRELH